jgi:integrase/recombinase XerD
MADVGSVAHKYVTSRRKLGEFAQASAIANRMVLGKFAEFVGRDLPIEKVARRHVEKWVESLNISPNSKRCYLSDLRTFLAWCVEHDLIATNPAVKVKGPKARRPVPRALSAGDITKILECVDDDRARLIVLFGAQEGMRAAEIAGIRREDLNLAEWLVTVTGKGSKQREIPISEETRDVLCRYLLEHPGPTGPLLRDKRDPRKGISPPYVSKLASQFMYQAGVKFAAFDGRSTHALRHSAASHMLEHGAEIRDVSEYLGHSELTSTQVYLRRLRAVGVLRRAAAGRTYMPRARFEDTA